uniref:Conopeptide Mi044 n=1 Tax=Conus miles TaxID=69564 RepID=A0A0E3SU41_CONMI|nr:conopeptide Mi044 [Conus miles]
MSKTGLVLVVLYLLSSPVNLQQNEDDQAFSKIETRDRPECYNCFPNDDGHCVGTCCGEDSCKGGIRGCGCV